MNFEQEKRKEPDREGYSFAEWVSIVSGVAVIIAMLLLSPATSLFAQGIGTQVFLPVVTNLTDDHQEVEQKVEIDAESLEAHLLSWQAGNVELPALGIDIGCVHPFTWYGARVAESIRLGDRGINVRLAQQLIMNRHNRNLAPYGVDGHFGNTTRNAITEIQQHWRNQNRTACGRAIGVDGTVGPQTWAILIYQRTPVQQSTRGFVQPTLGNATNLCAVTPASDLWGKPRTINALEAAGKAFARQGYGKIALNDISLKNGGPMPGHNSHQQGLNVDIRLVRANKDQCSHGVLWCHPDEQVWSLKWRKHVCKSGATRLNPNYDREGTRRLIEAIKANGNVKSILFNDHEFTSNGTTVWFGGHDDHLHVTYR